MLFRLPSTSRFRLQTCHWLILALMFGLTACDQKSEKAETGSAREGEQALVKVGSISIFESDLALHLKEKGILRADEDIRLEALRQLTSRAQLVQAALDAKLDQDPVVRAEFARILSTQYKEHALFPQLKSIAPPLPEARLRELYQANESRYRSNEKRQAAVLWLNAGKDVNRQKQYEEKLAAAREWFFKNSDLEKHPEQGFSMLGIDYSEHQSSRYKGGIVGWMEREGGMDGWTKAVAEIVFSLKNPGDVSGVIVRDEGVFLVRYLAMEPAVLRPFESVSDELEKAEIKRLRDEAEASFMKALADEYPSQKLSSATQESQ